MPRRESPVLYVPQEAGFICTLQQYLGSHCPTFVTMDEPNRATNG